MKYKLVYYVTTVQHNWGSDCASYGGDWVEKPFDNLQAGLNAGAEKAMEHNVDEVCLMDANDKTIKLF